MGIDGYQKGEEMNPHFDPNPGPYFVWISKFDCRIDPIKISLRFDHWIFTSGLPRKSLYLYDPFYVYCLLLRSLNFYSSFFDPFTSPRSAGMETVVAPWTILGVPTSWVSVSVGADSATRRSVCSSGYAVATYRDSFPFFVTSPNLVSRFLKLN